MAVPPRIHPSRLGGWWLLQVSTLVQDTTMRQATGIPSLGFGIFLQTRTHSDILSCPDSAGVV